MQRILLAALFVLGTLASYAPTTIAQQPPSDWPAGTPEEQGFDSAALADVLVSLHQDIPSLHSLMIIRNGQVILDADFYPYDGSTPHELASVTKSFMTTLIAIAADHGYLRLDQPMLDFFPDREIANVDARKEAVTVADLASMTGGLDCTAEPDEPTLDEMRASDDWIQFALDRPMVAEPGERWEYCSPDMHLLSAILTKATGMTALDFGWRYLFGPLGMREVIWPADPQGYTHGWGDIYLYPEDAAKLGQLWLNGGIWNGRQIVSPEWVEMSVSHVSQTPDPEDDYGYGWWVERESEVGGEYRAVGRSGNHVIVYPALAIVVVTTGGGDFDSGDVTDPLGTAVANPTGPAPANPDANARLSAVVAGLTDPPAAQPVAPQPDLAQSVAGTTYTFPDSPLQVESLMLGFDDTAEATLTIALENSPLLVAPVGLDGVYRLTPYEYGFPLALRGQWVDENTFEMEWVEIANRDTYVLEVTFAEDGTSITLDAREVTHQAGVQVVGTAATAPASPVATP